MSTTYDKKYNSSLNVHNLKYSDIHNEARDLLKSSNKKSFQAKAYPSGGISHRKTLQSGTIHIKDTLEAVGI